MTRKYYIKATLDGRKAAYKGYPYDMGENVHPNPDLSNVVCGKGFHLAKSIEQALMYVPEATEFYLATAGRILGEDNVKARTDVATLLWRIPQVIIDDYRAKFKVLDDDYDAKCEVLGDNHRVKCKVLEDDLRAKCKVPDDDYRVKCKAFDDDYFAKCKPFDDDYFAKRKPFEDDYDAKCKKLNRATMRRIIRGGTKT